MKKTDNYKQNKHKYIIKSLAMSFENDRLDAECRPLLFRTGFKSFPLHFPQLSLNIPTY